MRLSYDKSEVLRPTPPPRKQHWWMGALTLIFFAFVGTGLAIAIHAGMTFVYQDDSRVLNNVFIYLGCVGKFAQLIYETGSHMPTLEQHHTGELVCTITNAVVYTGILLAWFLSPSDLRLKK